MAASVETELTNELYGHARDPPPLAGVSSTGKSGCDAEIAETDTDALEFDALSPWILFMVLSSSTYRTADDRR